MLHLAERGLLRARQSIEKASVCVLQYVVLCIESTTYREFCQAQFAYSFQQDAARTGVVGLIILV